MVPKFGWRDTMRFLGMPGAVLPILLALTLFGCTTSLGGVDGHIDAGIDHDEESHFDDAIEEYDEAIALDPQSASAHKYRGLAYHNLQE